VFKHSTYKKCLGEKIEDSKALLERAKGILVKQYDETITKMLAKIPIRQMMCMSLFKWKVTRETRVTCDPNDRFESGASLGELEIEGIVFFEDQSAANEGERVYTIQLPLIMMVMCVNKLEPSQTSVPML
jgi:hypothetical protein